ncbi:hypothetical protein CROQUDRAFT_670359 [Cronartium quercuum f. sp. fusiforme G11]|uniref:Proline-rich protein PRCC n=1 Tax=Cronartium quercuum f. sp. fusiforme G11 TaxID=708437 RepID=A0A9P6TCX6_9BASI|nr:hypothetical protein CROQUDRAFT_670359 [Cronartium quercuum f. sp. fusiforme G11]
MALVEYGSESDSEPGSEFLPQSSSKPAPFKSQPTPPIAQSTTNQTGLRLPPPKRNKPTKARILLGPAPTKLPIVEDNPGNPKRSTSEDIELNKDTIKKPKLEPSTKKSGLAALLPAPKNAAPISKTGSPTKKPQVPPFQRIAPLASPQSSHADQPVTHQLSTFSAVPPPQLVEPDQPLPSSSSSGTLNLFGLPSASTSSSSSHHSTRPTTSTTISISSAPQVAEEKPPPPTLSDPYPGYWQRPNGQWCARSEDDEEWKAFRALHYGTQDTIDTSKEIPKDFFKQSDNRQVGIEEFNAAKVAKLAWENKPKIIDPREEARNEQAAQAAGKPAKQISSRARGRHQLSSLLTEAQANRAELEDRISRGKFNRKAGGAKYGF